MDSSRTSLPCCAHGYPRAVSDEACPLCLKAALASLREQLAEAQREAVGLLTQNTETWNRAIAAEREVAALKAQGACEWTPQDRGDDGWYSTDCGQEFCTIDDAPVPAEFKFCVYCGKPLAVAPASPTPEG